MSAAEFVVLHLPVDGGEISLRRTTRELESLQALVGGDIEGVAINGYAHAYVDEEALLKPDARPNRLFNAVLRIMGAPIASEQWVAGSAVIFGPMDRSGFETDVDPRVVSLVVSMGVPVNNLDLDKQYIDC